MSEEAIKSRIRKSLALYNGNYPDSERRLILKEAAKVNIDEHKLTHHIIIEIFNSFNYVVHTEQKNLNRKELIEHIKNNLTNKYSDADLEKFLVHAYNLDFTKNDALLLLNELIPNRIVQKQSTLKNAENPKLENQQKASSTKKTIQLNNKVDSNRPFSLKALLQYSVFRTIFEYTFILLLVLGSIGGYYFMKNTLGIDVIAELNKLINNKSNENIKPLNTNKIKKEPTGSYAVILSSHVEPPNLTEYKIKRLDVEIVKEGAYKNLKSKRFNYFVLAGNFLSKNDAYNLATELRIKGITGYQVKDIGQKTSSLNYTNNPKIIQPATIAVQIQEESPPAETNSEPTSLYTIGYGVYLRAEPNTYCKTIHQFSNGSICELISKGNYDTQGGHSDYWYQVKYKEKIGWIFGYYTSLHQ